MTLAVRGVVELFGLVKRAKELHREILAFSALPLVLGYWKLLVFSCHK
jgi:hypothetical protein